jgi:hypothetical protein
MLVHTNMRSLQATARQCAACCLQGWGGPDSAAKADALIRDVLGWFYNNSGSRVLILMQGAVV